MASKQLVPQGWSECRLCDLASINPDQLRDDTPTDTVIDYIDLGAVEQACHVPRPQTMRFGDAPSRARRRTQPGDILASTVRPYLRGFTRITENGQPRNLVASTGYAVIRPKEPLDGDFVYQHILSQGFLDHLVPRMTGSNYPAVNASDVEDYPLPCPPPEQRRFIGTVLFSVDDAIERTRAVIDQTHKLKTALLQNLLTNGLPGRHEQRKSVRRVKDIPTDWTTPSLAELGDGIRAVLRTGPFGSSLKSEHFSKTGRPVLTIASLGDGEIIEDELFFVDDNTAVRLAEYEVQPGDVVFSRVADVGRSATVPDKAAGWIISSNLMRICVDKTRFDPWFIRQSLVHSLHLKNQIRRLTADGGREIVNSEIVEQLVFPIPSKKEQHDISVLIRNIDDRIFAYRDHIEQLEQTKSALSQALLTGRVPATKKGGE